MVGRGGDLKGLKDREVRDRGKVNDLEAQGLERQGRKDQRKTRLQLQQ